MRLIILALLMLAGCGPSGSPRYTTPAATAIPAAVATTVAPVSSDPAALLPATEVPSPTVAPAEAVPTEAPTEAPVATPVAAASGVIIVNVDKRAETVTLKNTGAAPVNLDEGWYVLSVKGDQRHPIAGVLEPGEEKVFPGPEGNIWSNSDPDPAELHGPGGDVVDTFPRD